MIKPFHLTIGIIGGGQLGKMLIESSMPWNVAYHVLDPDINAPCKQYAQKFINASLYDDDAIIELAANCDIITFEIEHISVSALKKIEQSGKMVFPNSAVLEIIQSKIAQKQFYTFQHINTLAYKVVENLEQAKLYVNSLNETHIVLKADKGGYDGKGVIIESKYDFLNRKVSPFDGDFLIEHYAPNAKEIAIIIAKDQYQNVKMYPASEMVFDPQYHLLDYLFSPANISNSILEQAQDLALKTVNALQSPGVFAIEMFVIENQVFVNEVAPRPHNSGHHSIEANATSQYQQLARILLNLPLGHTEPSLPAVMTNLIGPEQIHGAYQIKGIETLLNTPQAYFHHYNKSITKPGRKLAHFTCINQDLKQAISDSKRIKNQLRFIENN